LGSRSLVAPRGFSRKITRKLRCRGRAANSAKVAAGGPRRASAAHFTGSVRWGRFWLNDDGHRRLSRDWQVREPRARADKNHGVNRGSLRKLAGNIKQDRRARLACGCSRET